MKEINKQINHLRLICLYLPHSAHTVYATRRSEYFHCGSRRRLPCTVLMCAHRQLNNNVPLVRISIYCFFLFFSFRVFSLLPFRFVLYARAREQQMRILRITIESSRRLGCILCRPSTCNNNNNESTHFFHRFLSVPMQLRRLTTTSFSNSS